MKRIGSVLMLCFALLTVAFLTVSGFAVSPESDFVVEYGTIVEYIGDDTEVVIPEKIGEYVMHTIDTDAFRNNATIESVVIPKSIERIETRAFMKCTSLKSITFECTHTVIYSQAFQSCTSLESVDLTNVTSLDASAFSECTSLKNVVLSKTIKSIPSSLFYGCTSLEEIDIPDNITKIGGGAFWQCKALKRIDISGAVAELGNSAFSGCKSLESIYIGENLKTLGDSVFFGCTSLESIDISGVSTMGDSVFYGCTSLSDVVLPENLEKINDETFYLCTALEEIYLPETVSKIGAFAFQKCTSLEWIDLGENITKIGEKAFSGCNKIVIYGIPDTVVQEYAHTNLVPFKSMYGTSPDDIESHVITNCCLWSIYEDGTLEFINDFGGYIPDYESADDTPWSKYNSFVRKIVIGNGIQKVGSNAIGSCPNVLALSLSKDIEELHPSAIGNTIETITVSKDNLYFTVKSGILFSKDLKTLIRSPGRKKTSFVIPDGTEEIYGGAFYGNLALKSITIPDSVTAIGDGAFEYCTSLVSVEIPAGITTIPDSAFSECEELSSVTFCGPVGKIGEKAFYNCKNLKDISLPGSLTSIGAGAFDGCRTLVSISIPEGVRVIPELAFGGCLSLRTVSVSDGVEEIGAGAFSGNEALRRIDIPDSVRVIGAGAFGSCRSLLSVEIPDGVKELALNTFVGCNALKSVTIPASVEFIHYTAISDFNFRNGFVIYGYPETYAEEFSAIHDGITFKSLDEIIEFKENSGIERILLGESVGAFGVPQGYTAEGIAKLIKKPSNAVIAFESADGEKKSSGKLVTGDKILLEIGGETVDSLTVYITGDVNGDGAFTLRDVNLVTGFLQISWSSGNWFSADLDGDLLVTLRDLMKMIELAVGISR